MKLLSRTQDRHQVSIGLVVPAVQVYCDMDRVCGCNSTRRWAHVAYLNMTDPSQHAVSRSIETHYDTTKDMWMNHSLLST